MRVLTGMEKGVSVGLRRAASAVLLILAGVLLSACGTGPVRQTSVDNSPAVRTDKPPVAGSNKRGGGYYKDDGPGDDIPDNLDAIPDAVPQFEALHRFANRPYTVLGQSYVPIAELAPFSQRGHASWYGRRFHNQPTSSGELYDMFGMTAAHPTLPIPSYVRVTNLDNQRSVIVRVNDRGPFHKERVIDLSYTAAYKLGYVNTGSAAVQVEQIIPGGGTVPPLAAAPPSAPAPVRNPQASSPPAASASASSPAVAQGKAAFIQLGAFSSRENAESFKASIEGGLAAVAQRIEIFPDGGFFRLHAGPYISYEEARAAAERIGDMLRLQPFIVVR